jgi:alcohol dehydrogenase
MKGIVYNGPHDVRVETVPDPSIVAPTNAIVRVTKAGICGSDMHIYNRGDDFGFEPGDRLGHEFVGVVEEVGSAVRRFRRGDKVVSPFWISCGECEFCRDELYTSCVYGGAYGYGPFWPASAGKPVEGGQSEYLRVPFADGTLEPVPESLADDSNDAKLLPLTDVFPTGYHAAICGRVGLGDNVVVIGDGAVGVMAAHAAMLLGAANVILSGHHEDRLAIGRRLGATHTINTKDADLAEAVTEFLNGAGPDAVLTTIASPQTMRESCALVRPGGAVGWVGMEVFLGDSEPFPWQDFFLKNITISGGVAPVRRYLRHFWPLLEQGRLDPSPVLTHDLPLQEGARGYEIMATREEGSCKVSVTP